MSVLATAGYPVVGALVGVGLDAVIRRAARTEADRGDPAAALTDGGGLAAPRARAAVAPDPGAEPGQGGEPGGVPLDRHLDGGGPRRLLVPAIAAAGCLLLALQYGTTALALPYLFFIPLLAELAVVDLHTRRLPNVLTVRALPVGLVLVGTTTIARGRPGALVAALVAAALLFAVLLALALLRPAGMGMGDVKMAAVIGLFVGQLGIGAALLAVVLAAFGALVGGLVLMALGRIGRRTQTPFGPWLAAGALVAVLAGPDLVRVYLALLR